MHIEESGRKRISGGPECLQSRKVGSTTPGLNFSETSLLYLGGYSTKSGVDDNGGADGNVPRGSPTERKQGSHRPVDHGGSLGGQCPH